MEAMIAATQLSGAELSLALGISERMLEQRKARGSFSWSERTKVVRITLVLTTAQRIFCDRAQGLAWLQHPNRSLHFRSPLTLLGSRLGTRRVLAALARIDAGGFA